MFRYFPFKVTNHFSGRSRISQQTTAIHCTYAHCDTSGANGETTKIYWRYRLGTAISNNMNANIAPSFIPKSGGHKNGGGWITLNKLGENKILTHEYYRNRPTKSGSTRFPGKV